MYRLANALARRGHTVTVLHNADAYRLLGGSEPTNEYPHEAGVEVVPLESGRRHLGPLVTYLTGRAGLYAKKLDGVFRSHDFDVVHFHNVSLAGGPDVLSYGEGVKLYTTHEYWLVCPMHVLWRYDRELCDEARCLRCSLAFHRPPQLWRDTHLLERRLEGIDLLLAPSRFALETHRRLGITRPIRLLPHFLPQEAGEQVRAGTATRPYFLFAGRLEKLKGVQTLLESFRSYREADLLIAGDGRHASELRRAARGLPHVHFLGQVHPNRLRSLYAGAIALLVPSLWYEVFGLVVLEAFAQRTPVLVNDMGALPELIEESGGGYVYRSSEELLDLMERLRTEPELRNRLGEQGHAAWQQRWSEERHLEGYFAALDDAHLARAGART